MDGRPVLGSRRPTTTRRRRKVRRTTRTNIKSGTDVPGIHADGEGDRVGHRQDHIGIEGTSSKLGKVSGRQKRPIHKDGPCTQ